MGQLKYVHSKGEIVDTEDNQVVATMSDSATKEQGVNLVSAYNQFYACQNEMSELDLLPQGPNCVNGLIKVASRAYQHLPKSLQAELMLALKSFEEYSVPVAISFDDITSNFKKSKDLFTDDFPKENGFPSSLTRAENIEVLKSLIATASDEVAQEKIEDTANNVFDKRRDKVLSTSRPKM